MLQSKNDGPLTVEQETQVRFIAKAAEDLSELVNDLLDWPRSRPARRSAPGQFEAPSSQRAARHAAPLLVADSVDWCSRRRDLPSLHTDESKVSQILRNFVSNASSSPSAAWSRCVRSSPARGQHGVLRGGYRHRIAAETRT